MMELFKLAAFAIAIAFINMILKRAGKDVESTAISIAGIVIILIIVSGYILQLFETVETVFMF